MEVFSGPLSYWKSRVTGLPLIWTPANLLNFMLEIAFLGRLVPVSVPIRCEPCTSYWPSCGTSEASGQDQGQFSIYRISEIMPRLPNAPSATYVMVPISWSYYS